MATTGPTLVLGPLTDNKNPLTNNQGNPGPLTNNQGAPGTLTDNQGAPN